MAKPGKSAPLKPNPEDPASYEAFDGEWRKAGLTGPARRALVDVKLYKVSDLRKISLEKLSSLPGMSKSAVARLKVLMNAKRLNFLP
jgi:hypothetical protein